MYDSVDTLKGFRELIDGKVTDADRVKGISGVGMSLL
jgi:hypothetical protein